MGIVVFATSFHWILKVIEAFMGNLSNTENETNVMIEQAANTVQGIRHFFMH